MNDKQKSLLKIVAPYITIIIALGGFWFTMTGAFQTKVEAAADKQMTIQTFKMVQQQFTVITRESQIERLSMKIDYLTKHKYELKDQLRKHPGDSDIQEEMNEVNIQLKDAKEDLKQLLDKPLLDTN